MKERGLFDEEERLNVLSKLGDNLETLNKKTNWELFRPILKKALKKEAKGLGGRAARDARWTKKHSRSYFGRNKKKWVDENMGTMKNKLTKKMSELY